MTVGYGSAPGKVILAGEHSVVYGYPAIVGSIGLRCQVKASKQDSGLDISATDVGINFHYDKDQLKRVKSGKKVNYKTDNIAMAALQTSDSLNGVKLEIDSQIPIGAGLGSSAAVSVATVCAVADLYDMKLDKKQVSQRAYEAEKIAHGTPSGIDNSIATYGGLLRFESGDITQLKTDHTMPLVIINTQIPGNTKELVSGVKTLKVEFETIIDPTLQAMGELALEFEDAFTSGSFTKVGKLFNINQGLLDAIGVGHKKLSDLIWKIRDKGAIGAKLTGAGGGGCLIALFPEMNMIDDVVKSMNNPDIKIFKTEISPQGAKIGL